MKKLKTLFLILIISSSVFSQEKESDATWNETIDWISHKLNFDYILKEYSYSITKRLIKKMKYDTIQIDRQGRMKILKFGVSELDYKLSRRDKVKSFANLHFLKNVEYYLTDYGVNFVRLTFEENKLTVIEQSATENSNFAYDEPILYYNSGETKDLYIFIPMTDVGIAERMYKAFNHLKELSQIKRKYSKEKF